MHELSITENILEIAARHAREAGAKAVTNLYLVIGELSSIIDESVQFYWDIVSEGTIAAGSQLHFRRIPAQLSCRSCGHTYTPQEGLPCPVCAGIDIAIISGEEFYLEAVDITHAPEAVLELT
ncbi:MAG: hydrogenase maturation nickel metallochaperone HypA [Chloroflexota bacterium]|jgi:hydrogenase nickel incorporation protein HypA/HybF